MIWWLFLVPVLVAATGYSVYRYIVSCDNENEEKLRNDIKRVNLMALNAQMRLDALEKRMGIEWIWILETTEPANIIYKKVKKDAKG